MSCPCLYNEEDQVTREIDKQLTTAHVKEERTVKILLLGTGEAGKSTVTKQMKIIHINGYSHEERNQKIKQIHRNVKDSILTILGAMTLLKIPLEDPAKQKYVDFIMNEAVREDFEYPQEFFDYTEILWNDRGVRACFKRSNEYQLLDCAKYFLDRISLVRREDYLPNDQDILRCRTMTNSIERIDFAVKDGRTKVDFSVFDVGGQRGERRKWIVMFEGVSAILFVLDSSCFDLVLREDTTKNRLLEALEIFNQVWNNRYLKDISILLFINKIDVLEEKINNGHSLDTLVDDVIDDENREPGNKKYANVPEYYKTLLVQFKTFLKVRDTERDEFLRALPREKDSSCPNTVYRRISSAFTVQKPEFPNVNEEVVRTALFIKRVFMQIIESSKQGRRSHQNQSNHSNHPQTSHRHDHTSHTCEYYYTCAVNTDNIKKVLEGCRSIIIRQHLDRWGIPLF